MLISAELRVVWRWIACIICSIGALKELLILRIYWHIFPTAWTPSVRNQLITVLLLHDLSQYIMFYSFYFWNLTSALIHGRYFIRLNPWNRFITFMAGQNRLTNTFERFLLYTHWFRKKWISIALYFSLERQFFAHNN